MKRLIINIGDIFSQLTVVSVDYSDGKRKFLCKCSCGKETKVRPNHLTSHHTQSCGCLSIRTATEMKTSHGLSRSRIYRSWHNMIRRCNDPRTPCYHNYGGRGISVCSEWLKFENFYDDMKDTYQKHLTIDRINNDGDYNKENCKWSTMKEQQNNKRPKGWAIKKYKTYKDVT